MAVHLIILISQFRVSPSEQIVFEDVRGKRFLVKDFPNYTAGLARQQRANPAHFEHVVHGRNGEVLFPPVLSPQVRGGLNFHFIFSSERQIEAGMENLGVLQQSREAVFLAHEDSRLHRRFLQTKYHLRFCSPRACRDPWSRQLPQSSKCISFDQF